MSDPTIDLLSRLVAIDSVNPSLVPGAPGERAVAAEVANVLRSGGLDVEVTDAAPGRPNVVGVLRGRTPGRSLMLCGHLDTVGVAGMTAPFDPAQRDGRLYGRGAQDMKGGVAAMIGAALRLAADGLPAGELIIAAVADEEHASVGADALVGKWRADAAVVTEPTDMAIAVAHKGFAWVEIDVEGLAAHGSRPQEGRDAILRMGRVLAKLEALGRDLQSRPPHPLLGAASLHASIIQGGRELSSYPDRCVLQMERRTLPGEPADAAGAEVASILGALRAEDPAFAGSSRVTFGRPPYELPAGHELAGRLEAAVRRTGRSTRIAGASFWADSAVLGGAGIPSVLFGPGGAGLHSTSEYVVVDDVLACRDALVELARDFCPGG
jgi:acetylornithine deacetylase/succinyl-diaminopimelate desuccinylase family protein